MKPFVYFVSIIVLLLGLTRCDACPFLPETRPASVKVSDLQLANGGGSLPYAYPGQQPDPGLFPPVAEPVFSGPERVLTIPLPGLDGVGQLVDLLLTGFLAWWVRFRRPRASDLSAPAKR